MLIYNIWIVSYVREVTKFGFKKKAFFKASAGPCHKKSRLFYCCLVPGLQSNLRFTCPWQRALHMRKDVSCTWGMGTTAPPPFFLNKNFKFQIVFRNLICFTNFIDTNSTPYATLSKKSHFYSITHLSFYVSVKKNPLQLKSNKLKKQMSYINNEQICIYQNIFNLMNDGI